MLLLLLNPHKQEEPSGYTSVQSDGHSNITHPHTGETTVQSSWLCGLSRRCGTSPPLWRVTERERGMWMFCSERVWTSSGSLVIGWAAHFLPPFTQISSTILPSGSRDFPPPPHPSLVTPTFPCHPHSSKILNGFSISWHTVTRETPCAVPPPCVATCPSSPTLCLIFIIYYYYLIITSLTFSPVSWEQPSLLFSPWVPLYFVSAGRVMETAQQQAVSAEWLQPESCCALEAFGSAESTIHPL